jgi:hypothetical protein
MRLKLNADVEGSPADMQHSGDRTGTVRETHWRWHNVWVGLAATMQMLRVAGRRSGVPLTRGPPLPRSQERRATSDGDVTTRRRMLAVRPCPLDAGQRDVGVVELGETCLAIIEFPTATAAFNAGRAGAPQFSVAP